MEDLKAYIESGVLELYALGDLLPEEKRGVELMISRYPELRDELNEIEKSLQAYAEKHAVEPGDQGRNKVLEALNFKDEASVNSLYSSNMPVSSGNFYKYAFAASVALLIVSVIALINLSSQLKESNQRIAVLETSNQKYSGRVNYINRQLSDTRQALEVYKNSGDYLLVELKGTPNAPAAKMVVAFSSAKEVVMIDKASLDLPDTDEQHQYQLWALVDGTPVDLGVFDKKADSIGMIKMKPIKHAQAFAVTLERKGGSATPTIDQMMVMGSI